MEGADFLLYVSGVSTERCGQENIVAYAAYCQLEAELDRCAVVSLHIVFVCVCVCMRAAVSTFIAYHPLLS